MEMENQEWYKSFHSQIAKRVPIKINNDKMLEILKLRKEINALKKADLEKVALMEEQALMLKEKPLESMEQIQTLKSENQELYKQNSVVQSRIISLIDQQKGDQAEITRLKLELKQINATQTTLAKKNQDYVDLMKEKDGLIQILKDELHSVSLELSQHEVKLEKALEMTEKLKSENKELLDRWILLKEKEAASLNEANEFVTSALKSKSLSAFSSSSRQSSTVSPGGLEAYPALSKQASFKPSELPSKFAKTFRQAHEEEINCLAISPDSSLLASGGVDKRLVLYQTTTGAQHSILQGCLKSITSISFSKNDTVLASSNDNSIKLWQISSRRLLHTLTGHNSNVFSAKFINAETVISGSHDRTIKIWDLVKGYCTRNIFTLSSCNDVCTFHDANLIVSGHLDNNLRLWDLKTGNMIREITNIHFQQVTGVEVSSDENYILTTSRDNTLKILDTRMYSTVYTLSAPNFRVLYNYSKAAFSSDGNFVASGGTDGLVYIWKDGILATTLKKHGSGVGSVVWSPSGGSTLYSCSDKEKAIIQWE